MLVHMANRSIVNKNSDIKRASISFPKDHYNYLEKLALDKKVSLAWIVREAVEVYVAESKKKS